MACSEKYEMSDCPCSRSFASNRARQRHQMSRKLQRTQRSEPGRKHMQAPSGTKNEPRDQTPRTEEAQVTKRRGAWSPRAKARVAGVFSALEGTASAGGQVVILGGLVVAGNAAATATNI